MMQNNVTSMTTTLRQRFNFAFCHFHVFILEPTHRNDKNTKTKILSSCFNTFVSFLLYFINPVYFLKLMI